MVVVITLEEENMTAHALAPLQAVIVKITIHAIPTRVVMVEHAMFMRTLFNVGARIDIKAIIAK